MEARRICDRLGLGYFDPAEREGLYDMPTDKLIDMGVDRRTMEDFVYEDEKGLDGCTCILVLTGDTPSDGAWWEMGKAYFQLKIPVVMVAPKRDREEIMGFSNIKVPHIFSTIEGALTFIRYGLNKEGLPKETQCANVNNDDLPF
jgi:hypothetical protein